MLRVAYDELYEGLKRAMEHLGLRGERAALSARLFAETTRDGVYTHGLNRFPRLAEMVANGCVDVNAEPERVGGVGALERWDGHLGVGNTNAYAAMERAIALAREHGLGAVAMANTNHWMRGGSYGWQAADAGMFAMCWTNTLANLPAWGAKMPVLGNNPLVIAIPRLGAEESDLDVVEEQDFGGRATGRGGHVVLDMAMSQFSYGALESYAARGELLPVPGGYDAAGELTRDAAAILATGRALPVGYWKGSGISMVLDMLAAMLSGGHATHEIPRESTRESGVSQVFLAIDPVGAGGTGMAAREELERIADGVVESLAEAEPIEVGRRVRYPGEETLRVREENLRLGVPVDAELWGRVKGLEF